MRVRTATGSIRLSNLSAGALTVSVGTGESTLSGVRCRSLRAGATAGDLNLRDVVAEGELSAHTTTGDIRLDRCDAASLAIAATTGDISGTLCSGNSSPPEAAPATSPSPPPPPAEPATLRPRRGISISRSREKNGRPVRHMPIRQ